MKKLIYLFTVLLNSTVENRNRKKRSLLNDTFRDTKYYSKALSNLVQLHKVKVERNARVYDSLNAEFYTASCQASSPQHPEWNDDSLILSQSGNVLMTAALDGVGGYIGGRFASRLASEILKKEIASLKLKDINIDGVKLEIDNILKDSASTLHILARVCRFIANHLDIGASKELIKKDLKNYRSNGYPLKKDKGKGFDKLKNLFRNPEGILPIMNDFIIRNEDEMINELELKYDGVKKRIIKRLIKASVKIFTRQLFSKRKEKLYFTLLNMLQTSAVWRNEEKYKIILKDVFKANILDEESTLYCSIQRIYKAFKGNLNEGLDEGQTQYISRERAQADLWDALTGAIHTLGWVSFEEEGYLWKNLLLDHIDKYEMKIPSPMILKYLIQEFYEILKAPLNQVSLGNDFIEEFELFFNSECLENLSEKYLERRLHAISPSTTLTLCLCSKEGSISFQAGDSRLLVSDGCGKFSEGTLSGTDDRHPRELVEEEVQSYYKESSQHLLDHLIEYPKDEVIRDLIKTRNSINHTLSSVAKNDNYSIVQAKRNKGDKTLYINYTDGVSKNLPRQRIEDLATIYRESPEELAEAIVYESFQSSINRENKLSSMDDISVNVVVVVPKKKSQRKRKAGLKAVPLKVS